MTDWRTFLECAYALIDVLDEEMQAQSGLSMRWYDVLLHLEDTDGLRMNEIAGRILFSKSGLTGVIDRMEREGLVRRERPPDDRRVIRVLITPDGLKALNAAREVHHRGLHRHYFEHLDDNGSAAIASALSAVRDHLRELRPGRIGT